MCLPYVFQSKKNSKIPLLMVASAPFCICFLRCFFKRRLTENTKGSKDNNHGEAETNIDTNPNTDQAVAPMQISRFETSSCKKT